MISNGLDHRSVRRSATYLENHILKTISRIEIFKTSEALRRKP